MNFSRLLSGCLLLLIACVATAVRAESDPIVTAKEHFDAGIAHIDDPVGPKYEEAYREFHASYAARPSYTTALNIGYCAYFLERDAEALAMYELYLAKAEESELPKMRRAQLERDVQALRAGLVRVTIKLSPSNATLVDERFPTKGANIVNRYASDGGVFELGIHPGNHRFTVAAESHQSQAWEFEAQPGSSHMHEFKLKPDGTTATRAPKPEPEPQPMPPQPSAERRTSTNVYVGAIVTGALAVGAVGMGLLANSKKGDFQAVNDGTQYGKAENLRSDIKTYALVSDICTGSAIIAAGITAYLYFSDTSQSTAQHPKAKWSIVPSVGQTNAGVALSGRF